MSDYAPTAARAIKEDTTFATLLPHHACSDCANALWRRVWSNTSREEGKKLHFITDKEDRGAVDFTCYCKIIHNYINLFPDDGPEVITNCDDWEERPPAGK